MPQRTLFTPEEVYSSLSGSCLVPVESYWPVRSGGTQRIRGGQTAVKGAQPSVCGVFSGKGINKSRKQ